MQGKRQQITKTIGSIVKTYRLKQKKSISQISAEIGMTKSMWADLEKGIKDPQLSTLIRIAEGLNLNTSEILLQFEKEMGENFSFIE